MESKNLLRQVKFFAHVFSGEKHRQLKNKILLAMDKNMLINSIVLVAMIILTIKVLSINILITPLLLSMAVVVALSLAICPLMMCLNWVNISLVLMIILVTYAATFYVVMTWIYANTSLAISPMYISAFVGTCLLLRYITQNIFWQRPMESLLKSQ